MVYLSANTTNKQVFVSSLVFGSSSIGSSKRIRLPSKWARMEELLMAVNLRNHSTHFSEPSKRGKQEAGWEFRIAE